MAIDPVDEDGDPRVDAGVLWLAAPNPEGNDPDLIPLAVVILEFQFLTGVHFRQSATPASVCLFSFFSNANSAGPLDHHLSGPFAN